MITRDDDPNDDHKTENFKIADEEIDNLLIRLGEKGLCGACTTNALVVNAMEFAEFMLGKAKAIKLFEDVVSRLREDDVSAPDFPSSKAH